MMHYQDYQDWLTNSDTILTIDTSVVINLIATNYCERILRALPNRIVAVEIVPIELEKGRPQGRLEADHFDSLVATGLVSVVTLDSRGERVFEGLVVGPAEATLDDGEAATIAYAVTTEAMVIMDERKAIRICSKKFPQLSMGCSVDILSHPNVVHDLGRHTLCEAVKNALKLAHMRVLPHNSQWVIDLIGLEVAKLCPSLKRLLRQSDTIQIKQESH